MLLKSLGSTFFAKVGVEGSNPFARSKKSQILPFDFRRVRRCVLHSR
jgi:hypothetical protein